MALNNPFDVVQKRQRGQTPASPYATPSLDSPDESGADQLLSPNPTDAQSKQNLNYVSNQEDLQEKQDEKDDVAQDKADAAQARLDAENFSTQQKFQSDQLSDAGVQTERKMVQGPDGRYVIANQPKVDEQGRTLHKPKAEAGEDEQGNTVINRTDLYGNQTVESPHAPNNANITLDKTGNLIAKPFKKYGDIPEKNVSDDPTVLNDPTIQDKIEGREQQALKAAAQNHYKENVLGPADDAAETANQAAQYVKQKTLDFEAAKKSAKDANDNLSPEADRLTQSANTAKQEVEDAKQKAIDAQLDAGSKRLEAKRAAANPIGYWQNHLQALSNGDQDEAQKPSASTPDNVPSMFLPPTANIRSGQPKNAPQQNQSSTEQKSVSSNPAALGSTPPNGNNGQPPSKNPPDQGPDQNMQLPPPSTSAGLTQSSETLKKSQSDIQDAIKDFQGKKDELDDAKKELESNPKRTQDDVDAFNAKQQDVMDNQKQLQSKIIQYQSELNNYNAGVTKTNDKQDLRASLENTANQQIQDNAQKDLDFQIKQYRQGFIDKGERPPTNLEASWGSNTANLIGQTLSGGLRELTHLPAVVGYDIGSLVSLGVDKMAGTHLASSMPSESKISSAIGGGYLDTAADKLSSSVDNFVKANVPYDPNKLSGKVGSLVAQIPAAYPIVAGLSGTEQMHQQAKEQGATEENADVAGVSGGTSSLLFQKSFGAMGKFLHAPTSPFDSLRSFFTKVFAPVSWNAAKSAADMTAMTYANNSIANAFSPKKIDPWESVANMSTIGAVQAGIFDAFGIAAKQVRNEGIRGELNQATIKPGVEDAQHAMTSSAIINKMADSFQAIDQSQELTPEQKIAAKKLFIGRMGVSTNVGASLHALADATAQSKANILNIMSDAGKSAADGSSQLSDAKATASQQVQDALTSLAKNTSDIQTLASTKEGKASIRSLNQYNGGLESGSPKATAADIKTAQDLVPKGEPITPDHLGAVQEISNLPDPGHQLFASAALKIANDRAITPEEAKSLSNPVDAQSGQPTGKPLAYQSDGGKWVLTDDALSKLGQLAPKTRALLPDSEQHQLEKPEKPVSTKEAPLEKPEVPQSTQQVEGVHYGNLEQPFDKERPFKVMSDVSLKEQQSNLNDYKHQRDVKGLKFNGQDRLDKINAELAERQKPVEDLENTKSYKPGTAKEGDTIGFTYPDADKGLVHAKGEVTKVGDGHYMVVDTKTGDERKVPFSREKLASREPVETEKLPVNETEEKQEVPSEEPETKQATNNLKDIPTGKLQKRVVAMETDIQLRKKRGESISKEAEQKLTSHQQELASREEDSRELLPGIKSKDIKTPEGKKTLDDVGKIYKGYQLLFDRFGIKGFKLKDLKNSFGLAINPSDPTHILIDPKTLFEQLKKFKGDAGRDAIRKVLEHEAIHVVGEQAAKELGHPDEIYKGIWDSLSDDQKRAVEEIYGKGLGGQSDANKAREYIRQLFEKNRSGKLTEQVYIPSTAKALIQKMIDLVKKLVSNEPTDEVKHLLSRMEEIYDKAQVGHDPIEDNIRFEDEARKEATEEDYGDKKDLLDFIRTQAKIPTEDPVFQGELKNLRQNFPRGRWMAHASKNGTIHKLVEQLKAAGYMDPDASDHEVFDLINDRLRSGKNHYPVHAPEPLDTHDKVASDESSDQNPRASQETQPGAVGQSSERPTLDQRIKSAQPAKLGSILSPTGRETGRYFKVHFPGLERDTAIAHQADDLIENAFQNKTLVTPNEFRDYTRGLDYKDGAEHRAFLLKGSDGKIEQYFKTTTHGKYGREDGTPEEYLDRIDKYNQVAPKDLKIKFVGISPDIGSGGARILTLQEASKGFKVTDAELAQAMHDNGWTKLDQGGVFSWRHDATGITMDDVHPGNVYVTEDGRLSPFDVAFENIPKNFKGDLFSKAPKQTGTLHAPPPHEQYRPSPIQNKNEEEVKESSRKPNIHVQNRLEKLFNNYSDGKILGDQLAHEIRNLSENIQEAKVAGIKNSYRVRGQDILMEKMHAAVRRGDIPRGSLDFARWLIDQNPSIADELGASVKSGEDASGSYNAASKILTLFKDKDKVDTAVHEILHHAERLMPQDLRDGIVDEWSKNVSNSLNTFTPDKIRHLVELLSIKDQNARTEAFKVLYHGNVFDYKDYALVNPSEFWAVKGTDILSNRFNADPSLVSRIKNWIGEMIQRAKGAMGLSSDNPVLKGLDAILKSNGEISGKLLSNHDRAYDITGEPHEQEPIPSPATEGEPRPHQPEPESRPISGERGEHYVPGKDQSLDRFYQQIDPTGSLRDIGPFHDALAAEPTNAARALLIGKGRRALLDAVDKLSPDDQQETLDILKNKGVENINETPLGEESKNDIENILHAPKLKEDEDKSLVSTGGEIQTRSEFSPSEKMVNGRKAFNQLVGMLKQNPDAVGLTRKGALVGKMEGQNSIPIESGYVDRQGLYDWLEYNKLPANLENRPAFFKAAKEAALDPAYHTDEKPLSKPTSELEMREKPPQPLVPRRAAIDSGGYAQDFSKSNRAYKAEEEGKHPATQSGKILGLPSKFIKERADFSSSGEFHHTSKFYNPTPYYDTNEIKKWMDGDPDLVADHGKFEDALKEWKQDNAERKSIPPTIHENQTVKWLEWGGTRNHPKSTEHQEDGVTIIDNGGKMLTLKLKDGTTFKKGRDTNGFSFKGDNGKHANLAETPLGEESKEDINTLFASKPKDDGELEKMQTTNLPERGKEKLGPPIPTEGQDGRSWKTNLPERAPKDDGNVFPEDNQQNILHAPPLRHGTKEMERYLEKKAAEAEEIRKNPIRNLPAIKTTVDAVKSGADEILKVFGPTLRSKEAMAVGDILRGNLAQIARNRDIAEDAMKTARRFLDGRTNDENVDFMNAIESNTALDDPQLEAIAKSFREINNQYKDMVRNLPRGSFKNFVENYLPHIWKTPDEASKALVRRIEGSKAFMKHRTVPTLADGIAMGLEPKSYNPVDMFLMRWSQMDHYAAGQRVLDEMKEQGLAVHYSDPSYVPDGWSRIDPRIGTSKETFTLGKNGKMVNEKGQEFVRYPGDTGEGQQSLPGSSEWHAPEIENGKTVERIVPYYAPDQVGQVLNNHLSPGLRDKLWYKGLTGLANSMNQAQLGFSAFHVGFTSLDAGVSRAAYGMEELARGKPVAAIKALASVPLAPITNILKGDKVLKEWMRPGSQGSEIQAMVQSVMDAGGRAKQGEEFTNQAARKMMQSFRTGNTGLGLWHLPGAILEKASAPILEYIVPRQKLGVFYDLAKMEMDKLGVNPSQADVRRSMAKAWDSVDNRLGQVVYDNLFWDRHAKDMSHLLVRSVGWNLGTFRELGGGAADWAQLVKNLGTGNVKDAEFSHRMAYTMALPMVVGTMGAMIGAMYGNPPQELKDYFFPKTNEKTPDGHNVRLALPSYMKDVYAFSHDPTHTVTSKLNPLWSTISAMLQNKDFYGTEIIHPDDPLIKRLMDEAGYAAKSYAPFSVTGAMKMHENNASAAKIALPMIGVTPAPSYIDQTAAEKTASAIEAANQPQGARTQQEFDKSRLRGQITNLATKIKDLPDDSPERDAAREEIRKTLSEAVKAGTVTAQEVPKIMQHARENIGLTPLQRMFKSPEMSLSNATRIWGQANNAERKQLSPFLSRKIASERAKGYPVDFSQFPGLRPSPDTSLLSNK